MIMFGVYGAYSTFSGKSGFLNCFFFLILTFVLLEIAALVARKFYVFIYITTLQDIFMWIIILGIGIMGERKYGDFSQKSPNFVPQIKLSHFHAKLFQRNQNQFLMEFLKIVKN